MCHNTSILQHRHRIFGCTGLGKAEHCCHSRGSGENKLASCEFTANFEALLIYTSIDDLLSASVADGFLYHQVEDSNPSEDDSSGISGSKFTPILFMFWSVPSEYLGPLSEKSTGHASVSLHLVCEGTVLERL